MITELDIINKDIETYKELDNRIIGLYQRRRELNNIKLKEESIYSKEVLNEFEKVFDKLKKVFDKGINND